MPIIEVSGPFITTEQKRAMARGRPDVAAQGYDRPKDQIIVIIRENQPENVGVGGELVGDRRGT